MKFTSPPAVAPLTLRVGESREGSKTVMLAGLSRGGTSATAAVIDALGVHLGETSDGHFETVVFKRWPFRDDDWGNILDYIHQADSQYENWGTQVWHNPAHIARIGSAMRNPHLVLVFRDPVALVQRHLQTLEYGKDSEELLLTIPMQQARLWDIARTAEIPTLLVSFGRLRASPEETIQHIAAFLELTPTDEQFTTAIARVNRAGGYLVMSE